MPKPPLCPSGSGGKTHGPCRPFKRRSDLLCIQQNEGKPGQTVTRRHLALSRSYLEAAEWMWNKVMQALSLRGLLREFAFFFLFFFFACLAMTLATWAALHLNGMRLLCSCAQYPAELRTPGCSLALPDAAVRGTRLAVAVQQLCCGVHSFSCA